MYGALDGLLKKIDNVRRRREKNWRKYLYCTKDPGGRGGKLAFNGKLERGMVAGCA